MGRGEVPCAGDARLDGGGVVEIDGARDHRTRGPIEQLAGVCARQYLLRDEGQDLIVIQGRRDGRGKRADRRGQFTSAIDRRFARGPAQGRQHDARSPVLQRREPELGHRNAARALTAHDVDGQPVPRATTTGIAHKAPREE
ncbi:unannotated protein [freshwater metagenome]|uniref:Unannotated protein n=1 Tax=freshwater metagenome TaxID=449393 RepID=A0A6J6TVP2_9ZZZZ